MLTIHKLPELWPSVARLIATIAIFVFHYRALIGKHHYHLNVYAILTFCFLSGYLSKGRLLNPHKWFIRRYLLKKDERIILMMLSKRPNFFQYLS